MATYKYPSSNLSFSQTVTKVAGDNKLANPDKISPGQTITLPDGSSVTAQKGDTLSGIVDKWKTNIETATQPVPVTNNVPPENNPPEENVTTNDENTNTVPSNTDTISVDSTNNVPNPVCRPNPLSAFSSSTYNISLYMINPDSYNEYSNGGTKIPKDWKLICRSGGINNTKTDNESPRANGFDLDYYIDNLKITSYVSGKETGSATTSFDFSFQIFEPYGFTFPTRLVKAATELHEKSKIRRSFQETITALQVNYLLVIRFYGYNKDGKLLTSEDYKTADTNITDPSAVFERSFPISIASFNFKLDNKLVTYDIKAKMFTEQAGLAKRTLQIPEDMTIKGETVRDILAGSNSDNKNQNAIGLIQRLNQIQQNLLDKKQLAVKDVYKIRFEGDENSPIANAFLVDVDKNPNEKTVNASVKSASGVNAKAESKPPVLQKRVRPYTVVKDSSILQTIDQIISQSSYVTRALKIVDSEQFKEAKENDPIYSKNTPNSIAWYSVVPQAKLLDFDDIRHVFATEITYVIKRYEVPYIRGLQFGQRTPYYGPVKRYKHWYMSNDLKTNQHQKEIVQYEVTYNTLYHNLAGYGNNAPINENNDKAPVANLSGGSNPTGKFAGWFDKTISPFKTFLYSPSDQLKAKIVILGDPDYLMTATSKGYEEAITKWFGTDQSINPNSGQIFIEIAFRSAEDYASMNSNDPKNIAGLLNPSQDDEILYWSYPASLKKQIQGVAYMVTKVTSTFNRGIFQQELSVAIPPFAGEGNQDNSSDNSETGRFNSASLNPNGTNNDTAIPSGFNTVNTATNNNSTNTSPISIADNSFTGNGLKVSPDQLNVNVNLQKPNSAFGVANDELTYSGTSSDYIPDDTRQA